MKLLLSGLDTVECAYYLRECLGCMFDFEALAAQREAMRASKRRDPVVVEIGGREFPKRYVCPFCGHGRAVEGLNVAEQ